MWKSHNFAITHILREINFEDSSSAKSAILINFEALNFDEFFHFLKALPIGQNSHPLKQQSTAVFALLRSPKLISRKI